MSSPKKQTVLITGATRGIGLGLTTAYLLGPNHTVIAAFHDPDSLSTKSLDSLSKDESSTLIVVKIDSASLTDASRAAHDLETSYKVSRIDTVIANAGTMGATDKPLTEELLRDVDVRKVEEFFKVNAMGVLVLFQAMRNLLMRGGEGGGGKFVLMGSPVGSLGDMDYTSPSMGAFGCSKAAAHYLVKKIAMEEGEGEDGVCAFIVDPGFVQTESGNAAAPVYGFGLEEAVVPVKESVRFLMDTIDAATKQKTSGQFLSFGGKNCSW